MEIKNTDPRDENVQWVHYNDQKNTEMVYHEKNESKMLLVVFLRYSQFQAFLTYDPE